MYLSSKKLTEQLVHNFAVGNYKVVLKLSAGYLTIVRARL